MEEAIFDEAKAVCSQALETMELHWRWPDGTEEEVFAQLWEGHQRTRSLVDRSAEALAAGKGEELTLNAEAMCALNMRVLDALELLTARAQGRALIGGSALSESPTLQALLELLLVHFWQADDPVQDRLRRLARARVQNRE